MVTSIRSPGASTTTAVGPGSRPSDTTRRAFQLNSGFPGAAEFQAHLVAGIKSVMGLEPFCTPAQRAADSGGTRLMKRRILVPILIAVTVAIGPSAASRTPTRVGGPAERVGLEPTGADMPTVGGNLANQHYSGLTQITKRNLDKLGPVWRTHVSAVPPATDDVGQQTTPIVADGVIYLDTPSGEVIAVDGKTGAAKWKWSPEGFGTEGTRRGVSIGDGKVYTFADGNRVVALDKDTGEEVWVVQPAAPSGESTWAVSTRSRPCTTTAWSTATRTTATAGRSFALNSSDGSYLWHFFGGPERGMVFTDVNGNSVDAGATWGPVLPDGTECNLEGGATPWMHGAIDPGLGMYYMTFGNARSCTSSQDGSLRPGDNLFSSTMVAVDMKTGAYKWHYQSIRHDVWDMDNVHPPTLADIKVNGQKRKVVFYGSKSGHQFVLDRTNGKPVLPVVEKPMIQDSRQHHVETQPFPVERLLPECLVWQKLGPENVPGDPWRAVPNYNGYQPDADGNLVFNPNSYVAGGRAVPDLSCRASDRTTVRAACTTRSGTADPVDDQPERRCRLVEPLVQPPHEFGLLAVRHQPGGALERRRRQRSAGDRSVPDRWHPRLRRLHRQGEVAQPPGHGHVARPGAADDREQPACLPARSTAVSWPWTRSRARCCGVPDRLRASPAPRSRTSVDGEQYVAVFAAGSTNPYGGSVTQGDSLWAFKLGGTYTTESGSGKGRTRPRCRSAVRSKVVRSRAPR